MIHQFYCNIQEEGINFYFTITQDVNIMNINSIIEDFY